VTAPIGSNDTARGEIVSRIIDAGAIAVIRLQDPATLPGVVDALVAGGVRALEVTMTVPGAVDLIRAIAPTLPREFLLGAGTVVDASTANAVIDAGARFVVGPIFRPAVIEAGHRRNVPVIPGCFSPTEIFAAWDAGADIVKVFPATPLGPGFFKDIRGPLPHVKLMPTGGVTVENAGEWIRAGAVAVGIGTALLDGAAIAKGDYRAIAERAQRLIENIASARRPQ
jgi:2-dehydro-3-deoxyphosphogluconate aldolase/(4S)-4-hydroxy-2-oxoglutarate aldolase